MTSGRSNKPDGRTIVCVREAHDAHDVRNEIVATGVDQAKNTGTGKLVVYLDTRAPDVTVTAPLPNACLNGTSVTVSSAASRLIMKNG